MKFTSNADSILGIGSLVFQGRETKDINLSTLPQDQVSSIYLALSRGQLTLENVSSGELTGVSATDQNNFLLDLLRNNVARWTPDGKSLIDLTGGTRKYPYVLAQSGVPCLYASATMGNNGSVTGIPALNYTQFPIDAYIWMPVGAIAAGVPAVAGLYYCQITSTTAATVFNNPLDATEPYIPDVPTAFSTTGPGAFSVPVSLTGLSIPIPASVMGLGSIDIECMIGIDNNTTNRPFILRLESSNIFVQDNATSARKALYAHATLAARGKKGVQIGNGSYAWVNNFGPLAENFLAIDTSVDTALNFVMNVPGSPNFMIIDQFRITVYPK